MIQFDHIFLFASDIQKSASFLSNILGLAPAQWCGADNDILRLEIEEAGGLQYHSHTAPIPTQHIAFKVDQKKFTEVVARLHTNKITFGNDPEDHSNMLTSDFLGGYGRVFFKDPDGHLFEVLA